MLQVKSFEVYGSVITRNGVRAKTLTGDVEKALNNFLSAKNLSLADVQVKQNVEFGGAANGGSAFITVLYNAGDADESAGKGESKQNGRRRE